MTWRLGVCGVIPAAMVSYQGFRVWHTWMFLQHSKNVFMWYTSVHCVGLYIYVFCLTTVIFHLIVKWMLANVLNVAVYKMLPAGLEQINLLINGICSYISKKCTERKEIVRSKLIKIWQKPNDKKSGKTISTRGVHVEVISDTFFIIQQQNVEILNAPPQKRQ